MSFRFTIKLSALAACCLATAWAETPLAETRSTLEKWVETRQLVSKTRSDWQTDKETLEQTVQLYERELKSLDDQLSKVSTNNTQVAREMTEATSLQNISNASLEGVRQFSAQMEARLKKGAPQLPAPLQDILKPMLARLPADPATTKMLAAERMQLLVGMLNELDKFNNSVNVFHTEKRRNPAGDEVAVQSVYVGLGAAYFVNEAADFAGTGVPGAGGWEWTVRSEIAPAVQEVVSIYSNKKAARFVTLPATIR